MSMHSRQLLGSTTSSERHWKVDDPESEMALILDQFFHIGTGGLVVNQLGEYHHRATWALGSAQRKDRKGGEDGKRPL